MAGLIPQDMIPTSSGDSLYAKLEKGENRFRILDVPTFGFIYWQDKTPNRVKTRKEVPSSEKGKAFWHCVVWMNDSIRFLEIDKKSVLDDLAAYDGMEDWGNLTEYDVIVTRKGDGMDTTYTAAPCPKKVVDKAILDDWAEMKTRFKPDNLFTGGSILEAKDGVSSNDTDLPF